MDNNKPIEITSDQHSFHRDSNFELLRIIAMLLIIGHHFSIHSGFVFSDNSISLERAYLQFISMGGKLGINLFILISGYFLINSKSIKISKIIKLWLTMLTYSVGLYIVFLFRQGISVFDKQYFLTCLLPVGFGQWGFATNYFVLFLMSPLLNIALKGLDKKTYRKLLILFFILWSVLPTINIFSSVKINYGFSDLLWFIYLYSFAGYIRLYFDIHSNRIPFYFLFFILTCFASYFVFIVSNYFVQYPVSLLDLVSNFFTPEYLTIFPMSVFMFLLFASLNIKYSKLINFIASSVFGIYLIHDNFLVRSFLWTNIFYGVKYTYSKLLLPYSVFAVLCVFVFCSIIELIRIYLLEKNYMKFFIKFDRRNYN